MDNQICEIFNANKILLKNLKTLNFSDFSKRRSYQLFFGIDKNSFYTLVFLRNAKSKLLKKEFEELFDICKLIETKFDTNIKKHILFYNSQICSKIITQTKDWKFYAFM
ncbi:hypothetical protein [Campylobacter hyointestinalis]|uniref:Uncharacterized protein n=1 Tax=Campylobacter hyointestinalis TaxID=198 RepID=A0A562XC19_CAMHY|nr:hypothetical protein [Campylobacter hyointestinalis]ANE34006.1 hypothetical protein CHL_0646 [Campylobacter hyointestinalis subsp. lawsonii CCUG 27631]RAZ48175.1 hypothetical protein CHL14416_02830 [Campylobacter hyointestinalis subsp. lawsonii]RAZ49476.1 hypothetical protein CHL9004_06765 [Campylobacter hyointestinalis subsp. lawsonii]RAZ52346.1 hypothetical protein CHL10075_03385 [Campylobacter hyointestinalis subsp. lawsonii]RAZ56179.1 hypothetical protein CHL10074_03650 [Campylobacter h